MKFLALILFSVFLFTACQSVADEETPGLGAGQNDIPLETDKPVEGTDPTEVKDFTDLEPLDEVAPEEQPELPLLKDSFRKAPSKKKLKDHIELEEELLPESLPQLKEPVSAGGEIAEQEIPFKPLLEEKLIIEPPEEAVEIETAVEEESLLTEDGSDRGEPVVPDGGQLEGIPSEMDLIPVNPLLDEPFLPQSEPEYLPPPENDTLSVILDKDEVFEIYEPPESENDSVPQEEKILDDSVYYVKMDHLDRLVIALDGSGWIFLSVLSPDQSSLSLQDKKYNPETKKTEFVFKIDGIPQQHKLVIMKQDLSSGESGQYLLTVEEKDMLSSPIAEDATESPGDETVEEDIPAVESPGEAVFEATGDEPVTSILPEMQDEAVLTKEVLQVDPESLTVEDLFILAGNYEKPGPGQSLERARECYLLLLDKFPVSMERIKAEERLRYLDRHYFKVQ